MFYKKTKYFQILLVKKLLFITFLFISTNSSAKNISDLNSINSLTFINNQTTITAPYNIIAKTNFTHDLIQYKYNNYILKINDVTSPEQCEFTITNNANKLSSPEDSINFNLPWWSKSAPPILKKLNFSKVNGDDYYKLDKNFQLKILPFQGYWGKVYVLEEIVNNKTKIICAAKLLLTRPELNVDIEDFRQRHIKEIRSNIIIDNLHLKVASKPYGIIKIDKDRYIIFLEYGKNIRDWYVKQPINAILQKLNKCIANIEDMHRLGYSHGDLTVNNMLLIDNEIKICDWFSLINFKQIQVYDYRYIGDNLGPEAMRAFYYDKYKPNSKTSMAYALLTEPKNTAYWLHPVAADRFCLGISLLEILANDLYLMVNNHFPENFDPYAPQSLDFWLKYVLVLNNIQKELLNRADAINNINDIKFKMLVKIAHYINIDPLKRK